MLRKSLLAASLALLAATRGRRTLLVEIDSQRPAMIPEELRQELHIRADKLSVLYRRWLNDLGIPGSQ